jgi:hypothetical protein
VRHRKRAFNGVGLRVDVPHGDNDAAVARDAGESVSVGPLLGKVGKCGVPEDVRLELLDTGTFQRAGVLILRGIPVEVALARTAREHPALGGVSSSFVSRLKQSVYVRRHRQHPPRGFGFAVCDADQATAAIH